MVIGFPTKDRGINNFSIQSYISTPPFGKVIFSSVLNIGVSTMWWKTIVRTTIALVVIMVGALLYGIKRWQAGIRKLQAKMQAAQSPLTPNTYHSAELEHLPLPVQRYFRTVLKEGQPLIAAASVAHTGAFNMSEAGEQWQPFTSTQRVITRRPGFVWDARIRLAPAVNIFVLDAYVTGEGILTVKPFGLVTVMDQPSTPELAQGELMRFFAEAVWYPTALLPSQGVVWAAVDHSQARATLSDGPVTVTLLFHFDAQGLIEAVSAERRYRAVDGTQVATPWQGRFWDYQRRDGMLVPLAGEVSWQPEAGPKPYWRGRIERVEYEYRP
jgi:hypothetical protein